MQAGAQIGRVLTPTAEAEPSHAFVGRDARDWLFTDAELERHGDLVKRYCNINKIEGRNIGAEAGSVAATAQHSSVRYSAITES